MAMAANLPAGVLERIGFAGYAVVFLGEPGIVDAAEVHVAGRAAGGDDDALLGAESSVCGHCSQPSRQSLCQKSGFSRIMPVILCSQKDLHLPPFAPQPPAAG